MPERNKSMKVPSDRPAFRADKDLTEAAKKAARAFKEEEKALQDLYARTA